LGKEDVACVTAIHYPLRNINSCSCNICSTIYVPNFVDRSAVNPHSKLQMRILLQALTNLDCASHRRLGTVEKHQRHSVPSGESDQIIDPLRSANLLGVEDDVGQALQVLALLIQEQL